MKRLCILHSLYFFVTERGDGKPLPLHKGALSLGQIPICQAKEVFCTCFWLLIIFCYQGVCDAFHRIEKDRKMNELIFQSFSAVAFAFGSYISLKFLCLLSFQRKQNHSTDKYYYLRTVSKRKSAISVLSQAVSLKISVPCPIANTGTLMEVCSPLLVHRQTSSSP